MLFQNAELQNRVQLAADRIKEIEKDNQKTEKVISVLMKTLRCTLTLGGETGALSQQVRVPWLRLPSLTKSGGTAYYRGTSLCGIWKGIWNLISLITD